MISKGFPNVVISGERYTIGEKPTIIPVLYTYINRRAGTLKPQSSRYTVNLGIIQNILTKSSGLQ